ncbi:MAG: hypothetical protein MUC50_19585 [Myxococcota bacterium]|jgi:hypothetical protein|nr:hypothetical protein [Myxococcota bacterium]
MRSVFSPRLVGLFLACASAFGCSQEAAKTRQDIEAFERAMGAVAMADKGSRGAAVSNLESISLSTELVSSARSTCVQAFTSVGRSEEMLAQARAKTEAAEAALAAPGQAASERAAQAASLGATASTSLVSLEQAISEAQALVDECARLRALLRARLSSR